MKIGTLKRTLTPLLLWGLGVGYVISGMYFGWNLGLEKGGTLGMAMATLLVIILYTCFSFSYAELACAIPKAGGAYDYAERAFKQDIGFITGLAQIIEFVFAPPAIAIAIGAYFNLVVPQVPVIAAAITIYVIFTTLNIYGVKAAANFELAVTVLAVGELLLFSTLTLPHFSVTQFTHNPFPHGWAGAFAAIPFAIWFFLGIEGVANVAEETINPQKDIIKGFGWALLTLVILCVLVFFASVGTGGWESIVYAADGSSSDSPLPLALGHVFASDHIYYRLLVGIGLFGLIASFHGLLLASGRATFEFGKIGNAPRFLGRVHSRFHTPANALIFNSLIGVLILCTGKTAEIIIISVFGALTLYAFSMLSVIKLRKDAPEMKRPFRVPFYPLTPIVALILAIVCLVALCIDSGVLALCFFGILLFFFLLFKIFKK
ncbi:MAG: ethanolamine permease [Mariniphaga sp.]